MKIIGIVGGIASGKSTIAKYLENLNSNLIIGDSITHKVLELPLIKFEIEEKFKIRLGNNELENRKLIGEIVLNKTEEMEWIEKLTFPIVDQIFKKKLKDFKKENKRIILDCPLLFESNWDKFCDIILFVETSDEIRKQRFFDRTKNTSNNRWEKLEQKQISLEEKKSKSHYIINNDFDFLPSLNLILESL